MLKIKEQIPLAPYTIYKIGGNARFFAETKTGEDIISALRFAKEKEIPFVVMGAGSNMLVSDNGFNGLLVRVTGGEVRAEGEKLFSDAGVMMARAVTSAARAGLTGFEWGIGVPGTIGGSVRGNAGCFGSEIKDSADTICVYDTEKDSRAALTNKECEFSYRHSLFKKNKNLIILSAVFSLKKGEPKSIQDEIRRITELRTKKQDIGSKSCGCIFKNVSWTEKGIDKEALRKKFPYFSEVAVLPNIPASFLIDRAELKGKRVGRAYISEKHANYFINDGDASAEEVIMLISLVKNAVRRKFGIVLEEEIQYVGF